MRTHPLLLFMCGALLCASCAVNGESTADDDPLTEIELGGEPGCVDWTNVDRTVTGGGEFLSPATYENATCFKAYLVNFVNYDPTRFGGDTVIADGGAIPTSQTACSELRVRAIVWRRNGSTMEQAGDVTSRGEWIPGADGVSRCLAPSLRLERDFGIVPNGTNDYRVAMTARSVPSNTTRPIAFVSVDRPLVTPIREVENLEVLRDKLADHDGNNLEPNLGGSWEVRATPAGQAVCRKLQVERGLHSFVRAALVKAGASGATVDARNTALANLRTALCTTGGTASAFHDAVETYVARTLDIHAQIRDALTSHLPAAYGHVPHDIAANTIAQMMNQAIGTLISKCDLDAGPLSRYLADGVLPAGVTDATRVVLGACSNQTPAAAAAGIGFGTSSPGGSNAVQRMADCMAGLQEGATETHCANPRADGAPSAPDRNPPPCINARTGQACSPELEQEVEDLKKRVKELEDQGKTKSAEVTTQSAPAEAPVENARNLGSKIAAWVSLTADAVKIWADNATRNASNPRLKAIAVGAAAISWAAKVAIGSGAADEMLDQPLEDEVIQGKDVDLRLWCEDNPADDACARFYPPRYYCPADAQASAAFNDANWFEMGSGTPGARQADLQDLFDHCLCDMVDADYSAIGREEPPAREPATSCPKSDEQRRMECVADPRQVPGDDDEPDRTCGDLLAPLYDDLTARARSCEKVLCPANQRPFDMPNGDCECRIINPSGGITLPDCRITPMASNGLCTPDATENCFCTPLIAPRPNGVDPFCRYNVSLPPGPLASMMLAERNDAHYAVIGNQVGLRVRTGGETRFVYPTFHPNTFAQRGTKLRQKVILFKTPAQGQNVDLRLYYTNRGKNLHHQFLGQCRMNAFAPGVSTNCDFDLPTVDGVNAGLREEPFDIEVEFSTAPQYTDRPALLALSFAGTLTTTPANKLVPTCPDPTPAGGGRIIPIINPWMWTVRDFNPNQIFELVNGSVVRVPVAVPVIR